MNTNQLRNQLRGLANVPVRFWAVAVVTAALLGVGGYTAGLGAPDGASDGSFMDEGVLSFIGAVNLVALALLAVAPIVSVRYLWGGLALLLPVLAVATIVGVGWPWVLFPALVAVGVSAVWRHPRLAWLPATMAAAYAIAVIGVGSRFLMPYGVMVEFHWNRDARYLALTSGFYTASVVLVMAGAHWMRLSARRSAEEADLERRQRETISQAAALSERSRLAHDLHDVVAHHVSLIAVRAETAPYTQPTIGPEARGVLTEIAGDARLALDELRGVLGILDRTEGDTADRSPQPGFADVPALVERSRAAGADVTLRGAVEPPVPPGVGYAAYRVVQEALTNARRHAPGQPVEVTLESRTDGLVVTVVNPLGQEAAAGAPGRGLAGMRERVDALGGRLVAEAGGDTFTVRAELPRVGR